MEAFKSIGQSGGNEKGSLVLSVLLQADQELRINIIEMLGKIKCTEAVPVLLAILKDKSSMAKSEQLSLQEKICNALGSIGLPEAIPILTEIAESKSFLGIRSYPEEVKYAAQKALAIIKRKPK
ncbi:MAG: HEAT repeat domain-containing protein [Smithella sp.]